MDRKAYELSDGAQPVKEVRLFAGHGDVPIESRRRRGRELVYLEDISYQPLVETDALAVIFADD